MMQTCPTGCKGKIEVITRGQQAPGRPVAAARMHPGSRSSAAAVRQHTWLNGSEKVCCRCTCDVTWCCLSASLQVGAKHNMAEGSWCRRPSGVLLVRLQLARRLERLAGRSKSGRQCDKWLWQPTGPGGCRAHRRWWLCTSLQEGQTCLLQHRAGGDACSSKPLRPLQRHSMHASEQAQANSVMPQRSKLAPGAGNMQRLPCSKGQSDPQPSVASGQ